MLPIGVEKQVFVNGTPLFPDIGKIIVVLADSGPRTLCRAEDDQTILRRLAVLFLSTPPELEFFFLGDHHEIQKLIRANR